MDELLVIVLGPGGSWPARQVARSLLERFPDTGALGRLPVDTLRAWPGVGDTRAARFAAARELGRRLGLRTGPGRRPIRGPDDLEPLLRRELEGLDREHVLGVYLDARHRVLGVRTISVGTLDASLVHPREVFRPAVGLQAAAVVVAHNHPSGCPQPSGDDLELTRRLGIELLDHVVVGDGGLVSVREHGWPGDEVLGAISKEREP
jgi:DNA repair protein RadC